MGGTSSSDITNQANTLGGQQSARLGALNNALLSQYGNMYGNYNYGVGRNLTDYSNIMNQYGGLLGGYSSFLGGQNPGLSAGFMPSYPAQTYNPAQSGPANIAPFLNSFLTSMYAPGPTRTAGNAPIVGTAYPRGGILPSGATNTMGGLSYGPQAGTTASNVSSGVSPLGVAQGVWRGLAPFLGIGGGTGAGTSPTGQQGPPSGVPAGGGGGQYLYSPVPRTTSTPTGTTPVTTQPVARTLAARGVNRNIDPTTGQPLPTPTTPTRTLVARGDPGAGAAATTPTTGTYGDLTNPSNWMNLVGNSQQLGQWLSTANPQLQQLFQNNPSLLNYYVGAIQKAPGANPSEQAGSAQYWINKAMQDPGITGGAGGGAAGGTGAAGGPSAINSWQQAIQTGMITPQQSQDLMARAVAPVRAAYQTAAQNVDRSRALTGGYAPSYDATQAQLARQQAYGMSDAETNAAASIVGMIQSGKLQGIAGLTGAQISALAGQNAALSGLTGLYAAQPGLASTFGAQTLGTGSQLLSNQQLQQALMNSILQSYLGSAQVPSGLTSALGNLSQLGQLGNLGLNIYTGLQQAGYA